MASPLRRGFGVLDRVLARVLILLVRCYQFTLSPWLGGQCRYHPTCSHYALEALERHGGGAGLWLAVRRVCRCHPFHQGGIDEVPSRLH